MIAPRLSNLALSRRNLGVRRGRAAVAIYRGLGSILPRNSQECGGISFTKKGMKVIFF